MAASINFGDPLKGPQGSFKGAMKLVIIEARIVDSASRIKGPHMLQAIAMSIFA